LDFGNLSNNDGCTNACNLPSCGDGFKNGAETDVDCGGGTCNKCALTLGCNGGNDCQSGFCSASKCAIPPHCKAIKQGNPAAGSGVYTIDPDGVGGNAPFQAFCQMTFDGGGWTLVLKADGSKTTFLYDAALWTNNATYQPNFPDLDHNEAKLQSFMSVPFTEVLLGMETPISMVNPPALTFQKFAQGGAAFLNLFTGGYIATAIGRNAWKALVTNSSLQPNCNREGFNVLLVPDWPRSRFGIVSNQENDCGSPDSYIGIGNQGQKCGDTLTLQRSVGNSAYCAPDNGDKSLSSFGAAFVR
jgi:hypothetical protein